jgi:hypothetical protein
MSAVDPGTEPPVRTRNPARGTRRGPTPRRRTGQRRVISTQRGVAERQAEDVRRQRVDELTPQEQDRVERAVAFCADTLTESWESAVGTQVADCISPEVWNRLFGGHRDQTCKALADMAKGLLDGKEALHDFVGSAAERLAGDIGLEPVDRAVVKELAKRIPIPVIDQKIVMVARSLQMIGILLCVGEGRPLNRCQCFIDLALAETKERVKEILTDATKDWATRSPALVKSGA